MKTSKVVDETMKQDIITLLCKLSSDEIPLYAMHKMVKCAQGVLETKYNATLGYDFNDPSVYSPWSNALQKDIERYDAFGLVFAENDGKIGITETGRFIIRTSGEQKLKARFGENLVKELQACAVF